MAAQRLQASLRGPSVFLVAKHVPDPVKPIKIRELADQNWTNHQRCDEAGQQDVPYLAFGYFPYR